MILPTDVSTYETLKEQIVGIYQKSRQDLLEEALGSISLDGQKQSACFLKIKGKLEDCNLTVDDKFIRHEFLQALPPTTRLHFLHIAIYRWKISPSLLTRYFKTQLLTTKWRQFETMITETKIELSTANSQIPVYCKKRHCTIH